MAYRMIWWQCNHQRFAKQWFDLQASVFDRQRQYRDIKRSFKKPVQQMVGVVFDQCQSDLGHLLAEMLDDVRQLKGSNCRQCAHA